MSASRTHMTAVEDRPLPMRKRTDLQIEPGMFQGEKSWIVKDPVSLKYHRLRKAEITVLNLLDGETTLRTIKERLQDEFPTKRVRLSDLQQLISSLYRAGMLLSDATGQADQLIKRADETNRREWTGRLSNVLSIRFPGYDPERLLSRLHPWFGWIFGRTGIVLWSICVILAGALLLTNMDELQRRLPNVYEFFSVGNFVWLAVVMGTTKICHELGHGLSCKHFGGECHEIGFMLLVFTPAMYCDTSDSWLLPNKWHRAFIGFAGMYVEVFLASIATFCWWNTQPGPFNFMCLNVMFVSSVSTIVFNANPLLRYDGYYILSDILEIPNLAQKSRLAMLNTLRVHCLGMRPVSPRQLPERNHLMFAAYSIASFLYRWFVLIMIVWFISKFFTPYGLQIIGHAVIAMSFFGMLVMPFGKLIKFFSVPGRMQEVKKPRLAISTIVAVGLISAICFIPIPQSIMTSVVVRPDDAENVYVSVPGILRKVHVQPGDRVTAGQTLAELVNEQAELQLVSLEGQRKEQEAKLSQLRRLRSYNDKFDEKIPTATVALEKTLAQIEETRKETERLKLIATTDGFVMPPIEVAEPTDSHMLPTWHGTPFDKENEGATLTTGTLFCTIGNPDQMKATLIFDQRHLQMIQPELEARIVLDEYPLQTLKGTIREVAKMDLIRVPRELTMAAGGPLATQVDPETGQQKTMFVMYEASVPMHESGTPLMNGFRGKAKIRVSSEPILYRIIRFIRDMVHFR